jgi:uncharacterized protein (DUF433 family)
MTAKLTIVRTPGICSGEPRVSGTRITVRNIVRFFMAGGSFAEIATQYDLPIEAVEEAVRHHMNARRH